MGELQIVCCKSCSFYEFDELGIRTSFLPHSHFALLNQEFYKCEESKTYNFVNVVTNTDFQINVFSGCVLKSRSFPFSYLVKL